MAKSLGCLLASTANWRQDTFCDDELMYFLGIPRSMKPAETLQVHNLGEVGASLALCDKMADTVQISSVLPASFAHENQNRYRRNQSCCAPA